MDGWISAVRTLVPLALAAVVASADFFGVPLGGEAAGEVAALTVAAAWWGVGRGLEQAGARLGWRWLERAGGWLLGVPRRPRYRRPDGSVDLEAIARALQDGEDGREGRAGG